MRLFLLLQFTIEIFFSEIYSILRPIISRAKIYAERSQRNFSHIESAASIRLFFLFFFFSLSFLPFFFFIPRHARNSLSIKISSCGRGEIKGQQK